MERQSQQRDGWLALGAGEGEEGKRKGRKGKGNLDGEGASGLVNEVGRCKHML